MDKAHSKIESPDTGHVEFAALWSQPNLRYHHGHIGKVSSSFQNLPQRAGIVLLFFIFQIFA
jgi:hypothetical protein